MIDLGDGKQVVVSGDRGIHLRVWAYGGSLGVDLTVKQAIKIRAALLAAILEVERRKNAAGDSALSRQP